VVSAVKATGQSPKQVISFAQQRLEAMALETSPEELAAKPGLLLDRREILRARIEVLGAVDEKVALDKKINDGTATAEDIARSDYLATRNQALIARLMPSASEAGRTLGAQRMLARLTTDPDFWVEQASDVARKKGGILSPADDLKVRQAAHEAGEAKKAVDQSAAAQQQAKRTGAARAKGDAIKKALAGVKDEIEQMRGEGPNTYTVIDKAEAAGLRPEKGGAEAKPVDVEKQGLDKSKDTAQGLRERDFALARLRNKAIAIQAQIDALGKDVEAIDPSVKADNSSLRAEQIKTAADAQREEPLTPGEAPKAPKNPIDQLSRWVDENEKQLDQRLSKVTQEKPTSLLNQLGKESEQRLAKARANLAKVTAESGPNSKAARLYDLWQTGLLTAAAPKAAVAHALSASVDLASYPLKVGLDVTQSAVRASASQLFQAASENEAGTTWRNKYWENRMTNFAPIEGFKARLRGAAEGAKQGAQIMNTGTSVDRFGRSSMQGTGFGRVEINYNEPEVAGVLGPVRTASATAFNSVAQAYSRTVHRVMQFAPHVIMGQEFEAKIAELARIQAKAEGATGAEYADRVKALIQNPMPSMQTEAAGYAAHLGLIDQSRYARGMTAIQRMIPGGKLVVPFPTVEGNIVGRAVEASPLGLFNEYSSFKTLFDEGMKGTEKEAARKAILTATARSGTSAAIIAGGYMLAKAGRMTRPAGVSLRPGETATDKLTGQAPGELAMFGVKGPERWYALDATGPYGILMQVGAEMYYSSLERDASVVASTGKAFGVFTRAIAESSAFTGLSTLADAARDPENMGDRYVRTLAGSVVPSIIGRTAMAVDPIDRFIGKPQGLGELPGYVGRAALSRIPFASRALPASVGAFGGEQEHDVNVMTSLGFRSTEDKGAGDPTIKAIEAAHFIISQVKQVRGESDEAFQQRQVLYGQMAKKVLTGVAANPEFQAMPATAARLIKEHPEWGPINPALLSDAIQRQIMHDELGKIEGALSSGLSPAMPRKLGGMVPRIAPDSASVARVLHNQASPDSTEP
jgi:hypothetical protein